MKKIFAKDITASTGPIVEQFQVAQAERRVKRDGHPYLCLTLKDRTGEIEGRLWRVPTGWIVSTGDFIEVEADTCTYRDEVHLNVRWIRELSTKDVCLEDFLPASKRDRDKMLAELQSALATLSDTHPGLKAALLRMTSELAPGLLNAPAAKTNHHAYVGGLLEHVLSLTGLACRVCTQYPELDRDMLVAAAVLHDIGKLHEFCYETGLNYTRRGTLIGHCVLGMQILAKYAESLDQATREHLGHIVLSHHGQAEWGAVKPPMTREARVFHLLDMIDSQMATMNELLDKGTDSNGFTPFVPALRSALWNGQG